MTVINGVNLTGDSLVNIHIMAPMLDESAREKALAYMIGLITGQVTLSSHQKIVTRNL